MEFVEALECLKVETCAQTRERLLGNGSSSQQNSAQPLDDHGLKPGLASRGDSLGVGKDYLGKIKGGEHGQNMG